MLKYYYKSLRSKGFKEIDKPRKGCWMHVESATKKDLMEVVTLTGLSYEDIHDSLDIYELPRFERIGENLLIFVRNPVDDVSKGSSFTETLLLIITPEYLVTISPQENPLIGSIIKEEESMATTQQSKFLLHILLKVAKSFNRYVRSTRIDVIGQKKAIDKVDRSDILVLIESEEVLNRYISALVPMEHVFGMISSGKYLKLFKEDEELFKDVLIEIQQAVDLGRVTLKSIVSLRDSYQIIFTNRLNKTINILTIFTIVLTIPTVVGSFWGMNVSVPFAENPMAFGLIVWGSIVFSLLVFLGFYWRKWV